jgi:hypothetical protein
MLRDYFVRSVGNWKDKEPWAQFRDYLGQVLTERDFILPELEPILNRN